MAVSKPEAAVPRDGKDGGGYVIITAPHYSCPKIVPLPARSEVDSKGGPVECPSREGEPEPAQAQAREHPCDIGAQYVAIPLYVRLLQSPCFGPSKVFLLLGDVPRGKCDLNRKPCRDQPFRRRLEKVIKACQKQAVVVEGEQKQKKITLLDLHSFPERDSWERGGCDDVVLLYVCTPSPNLHEKPEPPCEYKTRSLALAQALAAPNIKVRALPGTQDNDILLQGQELGVDDQHLIEFGEFLSLRSLDQEVDRLFMWLTRDCSSASTVATLSGSQ